jgi:hypothetical protein
MNYQVYEKIVIDKRNNDHIRDLSIYAVDLYTDCDDNIFKCYFIIAKENIEYVIYSVRVVDFLTWNFDII